MRTGGNYKIEHKGFTLIELLFVMAILGIVLGAFVSVFVMEDRSSVHESGVLAMKDTGRAVMDFIGTRFKGAANATITISGGSNATFSYIEAFGRSTGSNSASTLNDTTQSWTSNQWQNYQVLITNGTGSGQAAANITSNTSTQLSVSPNWTTTPDNTSEYKILSTQQFWVSGAANNLYYQKNNGATGVLTNNVTLTISQATGSVTINGTFQAANVSPLTNVAESFQLRSVADVRN